MFEGGTTSTLAVTVTALGSFVGHRGAAML